MDDKRNIYYAQIRGLLVDNYCEKSAYLTWLIPTQASPDPHDGFDPASYLIGMLEFTFTTNYLNPVNVRLIH